MPPSPADARAPSSRGPYGCPTFNRRRSTMSSVSPNLPFSAIRFQTCSDTRIVFIRILPHLVCTKRLFVVFGLTIVLWCDLSSSPDVHLVSPGSALRRSIISRSPQSPAKRRVSPRRHSDLGFPAARRASPACTQLSAINSQPVYGRETGWPAKWVPVRLRYPNGTGTKHKSLIDNLLYSWLESSPLDGVSKPKRLVLDREPVPAVPRMCKLL